VPTSTRLAAGGPLKDARRARPRELLRVNSDGLSIAYQVFEEGAVDFVDPGLAHASGGGVGRDQYVTSFGHVITRPLRYDLQREPDSSAEGSNPERASGSSQHRRSIRPPDGLGRAALPCGEGRPTAPNTRRAMTTLTAARGLVTPVIRPYV
jgi:hypothetical protein